MNTYGRRLLPAGEGAQEIRYVAKAAADFDPLVDELPSRYVVGIDLGTTNSAVCYVDTLETPWQVCVFPITQLVAPGETEARETLPSFHFQPTAAQLAGNAYRLPWQKQNAKYCVGIAARDEASKTSGRVIASAKSWLCHAGVDRTVGLLPWHAAADIERLSPVEASACFLRHIREAWNREIKNEPLQNQDIVLTLPASFDEVARELTVEAAAQAGLPRVVLIEEPQAAFYAWVYKHAEDWQQLVSVGQKILVCDIGGGTTDFTLIRVRASETAGDRIQFHRVAVGNHLILGGDNLDLALARHIEQKLKGGGKLEARQWDVLVGTCRQVKEQLLGDKAPQRVTVSLPGGGSKLIGGSLQAEVTCQEVTELLVEGFLPMVDLNSKPVQHASGFQEFGLPYASDPAISKYLAAFLIAHRDQVTEKQAAKKRSAGKSGTRETAVPDSDGDVSLVRPDVVLFNGGFFESGVLRQRVLTALTTWFGKDNTDPKPKPAWEPIILDNDQLHLAVARGAAYYGMVRRGAGVRIAASLARSYYIGVESGEPQAVCIVPGSAETGQEFELSQRTFQLTISQPVEFSLFVSSTRLDDEPGEIFSIDPEQMTALPPIRTVLRAKSRNEKRDVAVRLHVRITEIGTIDLSCHEVDSDRSWKLQFDIRAATQTDVSPHQAVGEAQGFIDESIWLACRRQIADVFSGEGTAKPNDLIKRLAGTLECERHEWPMSLLRSIWEALMELEPGRRRSAAHEARWLNLLGYALRPGYGFAVDDWRVTETWRTVNGKLAHGTPNIRAEALILWRRLAGGLSLGQQLSIADPLLSSLRGLHRRLSGNKAKAAGTSTLRAEDTVEIWRLLGSLELLSIGHKVELGNLIVDLLDKPSLSKATDAMFWALGRLGQRVPLYGPLNTVVPVERMSPWLDRLLDLRDGDPLHHLAIVQMTRRTEDRYRDLPEEKREEVVRSLQAASAAEHLVKLVAAGGRFDAEEQGRVFGEALPKGLRLE